MKQYSHKDLSEYVKSIYKNEDVIPLHKPVFGKKEKKYVLETIESTLVSSVGSYVDLFEKKICDIVKSKYSIATVNGTSALHIGLKIVGVKPNELVLTQAFSFVATCNAIKYTGAEPVFVDISKKTLGICPKSLINYLNNNTVIINNECIHKKSGKKISACVPMHTFGHPSEINKILKICETFNIKIVEDAAEAIGSLYKKKHLGTFGDVGIFSFNGNKTITCGGGGIIITNNKKLAIKAKHLTTQAKVDHKWEYFHDELGYNYRMPNINAALGCAQLENLNQILKSKREIASKYLKYFENSNFEFVKEPKDSKSNFWLNAILTNNLNERNELLLHFSNNQIFARPAWTLLNNLPMFESSEKDELINSKWVADRLINIPSYPILK